MVLNIKTIHLIGIIFIVAVSSAAVGLTITYSYFPKTDPELKALLQKQVSLAEKDQADKAASEAAMKKFFK